jgi:pterin-4a-carbinolamine dehydratase
MASRRATGLRADRETDMPTLLRAELVRDALHRLNGWTGDTAGIGRTFDLEPARYGEFVERLKVCSDALRHRPLLRRSGTQTHVWLCSTEGGVTESDIALAARINLILRRLAPSTNDA